MAHGPTEKRDTRRAAIADYATLVFGIILVGAQVVEYIQGNIEGTKVEVGTFFIGVLLIIRPTTLVDIANFVVTLFKKNEV